MLTPSQAKQQGQPMTIENEEQLEKLRHCGHVVAATMTAMAAAMEPGMTTRELDAIGRALLEREGARSAPETTYAFPGATCISVSPAIAHGIPGDKVLQAGDLVNIDVSADIDGYYADTGGSFTIPPVREKIARLCRDGKRAMWTGIKNVKAGGRLNEIGRAIQAFADKNRYTLIRNLASHGVGGALHEEPTHIPTWHEPHDSRRIHEGLVFTIEPFLSTGSHMAVDGQDDWTLVAEGGHATVQYEHTLVATRRGPVVLTRA
jgi:methionyl aminopeptidase